MAEAGDGICRICLGDVASGEVLKNICLCRGSLGCVHRHCLDTWLQTKPWPTKYTCEICRAPMNVKHRWMDNMLEPLPTQLVLHPAIVLVIFKFNMTIGISFMFLFVDVVSLRLILTMLTPAAIYLVTYIMACHVVPRQASKLALLIEFATSVPLAVVLMFMGMFYKGEFLWLLFGQTSMLAVAFIAVCVASML